MVKPGVYLSLMRGLTILVLLTFTRTIVVSQDDVRDIGIMTYNIRYANAGDGEDRWEVRKQELTRFISDQGAAFIGLQEALHEQVRFVDHNLTDYRFTGVGRDDGATGGEYSPIFYDTTRFQLLNGSTFWLSDHPDTVSVGWDASMERICTYGQFTMTATGKIVWVFNAHFDHRGPVARERSAQLIIDRIQEWVPPNQPVFLMGDFNAVPTEEPIQIIRSYLIDPLQTYSISAGELSTWNGFRDTYDQRRIDYIFIKNLPEPDAYRHLKPLRSNGRQLSDHFPVLMTVRI